MVERLVMASGNPPEIMHTLEQRRSPKSNLSSSAQHILHADRVANEAKKFSSNFWVIPKNAGHAARFHLRALFLNSARGHAHMMTFNHNSHSL